MTAQNTTALPLTTAEWALVQKPATLARFWLNVAREGHCWVWKGTTSVSGYGRFSLGGRAGRDHFAHRLAYQMLVGPLADGFEPDHLCRNRLCVRPQHLQPVTSRVNTLRGISPSAVNAMKTTCQRGHPLAGDNLHIEANGGRTCLTCRRAGSRARYVPKGPATACKRGHLFDQGNTAIRRDGRRRCRQCAADRARREYWKMRVAA